MDKKQDDEVLCALVSDYLSENCKSLADEFRRITKSPILPRESPNLREILKFYLKRSYKQVAVVYRVKEYGSDGEGNSEQHFAVYHSMRYQPIPIRSGLPKANSPVKGGSARTQGRSNPAFSQEMAAENESPPVKTIKKSTAMVTKRDTPRKRKLTPQKFALIKNAIQNNENVSIVKKFPKKKKKFITSDS